MNKKLKIFIFCLMVSCLTLLVASKNSFLYPMNDGVDMNAYFTVGKGMFDGVLPYKDLFEQKGPIVYFIYGIASLISSSSFIGVFIFEVILFSLFLFYSSKIIMLVSKQSYIYLIIPLLALLTSTSENFCHGGSVEELCLPLVTYTLYLFLKFLKNKKIKPYETIIGGVVASILFLSKYTLVGISVAFGLIIAFLIFKQDGFKSLLKFCLLFMLGIFIVIIPWLIYFIVTDSLKDFIDVYFVINLTAYSSGNGFISNVLNVFDLFFSNILKSGALYLVLFVLSFCWIKKYFIKEKNNFIYLCLFAFITIAFIYIGNTVHTYYALILYPFMLGGLIWIFEKIEFIFNKIRQMHFWYIVYIIYCAVIFILLFKGANYIYLIGTPKNHLMQYKFAEIISKEENATILEYGWLDSGLYFSTNKIPTKRYFIQLNFDYDKYPTNHDEQVKYIENGEVDFILLAMNIDTVLDNSNLPDLFRKYTIVSSIEQLYEGTLVRYYLLQKIKRT